MFQIELTLRLVSEGKLRRYQKKTYRDLQGKVALQWDLFRAGEKTAMQMLKAFVRPGHALIECKITHGECF